MAINPPTIEELLQEISLALAEEGAAINDMNQGAKLKQIAQAYARPLAEAWNLLRVVARDSNPATARGASLKLLVNTFGMYEKTGSPAEGYVLAQPTSNGNQGQLNQGDLLFFGDATFVVMETTLLGAPYGLVPIQAGNIGTQHRLPANTTLVSANSALNTSFTFKVGSSLNGLAQPVGGMTGGEDEETDDQIVARFADYISSLTRGVYKAVYQAALSIPGIRSLSLVEFRPMIGMCTLFIDDGSSSPTVATGLQTLIQDTLREWRAAGVPVKVRAMEKVQEAVELDIQVAPGYVVETVEQAANAALTTVLNNYTYGQTLYTSRLVDIAHVEGVLSAKVKSPLGEKVTVNPNQVFRPLSVKVNGSI